MKTKALGAQARSGKDLKVVPETDPDTRLETNPGFELSRLCGALCIGHGGMNVGETEGAKGQVAVEGNDVPTADVEVAAEIQARGDGIGRCLTTRIIDFRRPDGSAESPFVINPSAQADLESIEPAKSVDMAQGRFRPPVADSFL